MSQSLRIAMAQFDFPVGDVAGNARRIVDFIAQARDVGVPRAALAPAEPGPHAGGDDHCRRDRHPPPRRRLGAGPELGDEARLERRAGRLER